jgi:glycosyltransferase involved in cell wall biosynthesis
MPKVTIIIPVYNVEKYLRECLDSVVNQTLRDIEIICVNDGSPDGSPQILEEYAAKDSRIIVINKKNGGLSSARNAAFPYIKCEYTLFVDSDDWLEPDLCEKTVTVADKEQADMTLFFYHIVPQSCRWYPLEDFLNIHSVSKINTKILIQHTNAWSKLWKSDFLLKHDLRFPEGLFYEDIVVNWKALANIPRLAILQKSLYWYRQHSNSIMLNNNSFRSKDIFSCYKIIRQYLEQNNLFSDQWKTYFFMESLQKFRGFYLNYTSPANKPLFLKLIKQSLNDEYREFLTLPNDLSLCDKIFYYAIDGSYSATIINALVSFLRQTKQTILISNLFIQKLLQKI